MTVFFMTALTAKVLGICDFYYLLEIFHVLAIVNIIIVMIIGIRGCRQQTTAAVLLPS